MRQNECFGWRLINYRCNVIALALAQSKVTAQGQISVPSEVRRKLGIGPGSVLEWKEEGDAVVVRKAGRLPLGTFDRNLAKLDGAEGL
jgi:AbrB family looped-hinge helix DNA binding protein